MLPKTKRLSRTEINQVKLSSLPVSSRLGLVYQVAGTGKAAVIVTKKVAKLAVDRNRLRRRFYLALQKLNFATADIIIYPNSFSLSLSSEQLIRQLSTLLTRK